MGAFDKPMARAGDESDVPASGSLPSAAPPAGRVAGPPRWIPIRSLEARDRPRILKHLLALDERDRYLRFGHMASDAQITRYVELLDFEHDEVFGVFDRRLELVAMAHLVYLADRPGGLVSPDGRPVAEFGVSVDRRRRGRAFGERLFDRAALHARNRQIDTLLVHALSENTAMLRIARNAGARIERDGPESQAWVKLAPASLVSRVEALVEDRAADLDYGFKRRARRASDLLDGDAEA